MLRALGSESAASVEQGEELLGPRVAATRGGEEQEEEERSWPPPASGSSPLGPDPHCAQAATAVTAPAPAPVWLERTALLLGEAPMERLRRGHVLLVGLGGVGSYAAEFLVRGGERAERRERGAGRGEGKLLWGVYVWQEGQGGAARRAGREAGMVDG